MNPPLADLRARLDTLELDDFLDLCQTQFPSVSAKFTDRMTRPQQSRLLLDHVQRRGETDKLLTALQVKATLQKSAPPTVHSCEVLVLAANPFRTASLDLEAEAELIRQRLGEGEAGRRLRVHAERAVRPDDLSRLLLQYNPFILHFSGHGSPDGDLIFEGPGGTPQPVPQEALARLIAAVRGELECVVLNACFTLDRAEPLAASVRCVIGMSRAFDDASAQRFAAGFYRGIAFGKDYLSAFELGRAEIGALRLPDEEVPRFLSRDPDALDPNLGPARVNRTIPIAATPPDRGRWWYPLWYGTHRRFVDTADPTRGYTGERDTAIHFGTCRVSIPHSHRIGHVSDSFMKRLFASTDPKLKLDRNSLRAIADAATFWDEVGAALAKVDAGERSALVYIHGYNVSFEDAALRAAQIGFDLQVSGLTAFYSWPSQGSWRKYAVDEATIGASHLFLAEFLTGFVRHSGAERVHLIAHSMGNRALLRCLQRVIDAVSGKVPFGQVFLAAPDVDTSEFLGEAAVYRAAAERTTLYASSRDKALATSGGMHGYARAGYLPPVTIADGIDTVEVSNVDLSWLGHSTYAEARPLLADLQVLLLHNTPPAMRLGLRQARTREGHTYWIIGA